MPPAPCWSSLFLKLFFFFQPINIRGGSLKRRHSPMQNELQYVSPKVFSPTQNSSVTSGVTVSINSKFSASLTTMFLQRPGGELVESPSSNVRRTVPVLKDIKFRTKYVLSIC